ncbi:MAG TPA: M3 family metallopeptidase [Candidatus Babeliales bacterium]|nr:M3 family metallopeptidase [Candidatus Babeliales bacterium]
MKMIYVVGAFGVMMIGGVLLYGEISDRGDMNNVIQSRADIAALFPKTVIELNQLVEHAKKSAAKDIDAIIAVPDTERTFANTALAFDRASAFSDLMITTNVIHTLTLVCPDDALRQAAEKADIDLKEFIVVYISDNAQLYNVLKTYDINKNVSLLNAGERYFLQETLADYKRAGLDLDGPDRAKVIQLKKELAQLTQQFAVNIATDASTIAATQEQLAGLDADFIAALRRNDAGLYVVGVDGPTYTKVMENCTVTDTRKRLYEQYNNRAYPANEQLLKIIIAKRDELARVIGFVSYAHLLLDNSMVKNPEAAQQFLNQLIVRATKKALQESAALVSNVPSSVALTADGKINPWDYGFVSNQYKKNNLAVDEQEIANYFPMEKTVAGLLDVYRQFLGLEFVTAPISGLWSSEVQLIEVYEAADRKQLLGYLLLDLFPRPNKFSHACEMGIVPSVIGGGPGLALVVANFTRATASKPALLDRNSVATFFHEFGHALHELLGRTMFARQVGTSVKMDFVEMPSQMLEEWLWDAGILRKISSHYQTGKPLSDELISKIQNLKHFDTGVHALRQAFYAQLSLDYYKAGANKDVKGIFRTLYASMLPMFVYVDNNNMFSSFGHLTDYGPQYYGYMWSKVYALDLFEQIKKQGLLNSVIGKKYIREILQPGGSKDPNELLYNFLGRQPSQDAFFKDLGI